MNVLREPVTITVELEVERYREFRGENGVQVWGFVGDYEVCVCLPKTDERVRKIKARMGGERA
jgi:hypothetical protein